MAGTIIIGDLHGCLRELKELLEQISYSPPADQLILVGDLMDRGPDSPGTIQFVRELSENKARFRYWGNHDEKYVRYVARIRDPVRTEIDRANAESVLKSERVGAAWSWQRGDKLGSALNGTSKIRRIWGD